MAVNSNYANGDSKVFAVPVIAGNPRKLALQQTFPLPALVSHMLLMFDMVIESYHSLHPGRHAHVVSTAWLLITLLSKHFMPWWAEPRRSFPDKYSALQGGCQKQTDRVELVVMV